jgi:ABC-type polysaccharide/polyol phosphate export permease
MRPDRLTSDEPIDEVASLFATFRFAAITGWRDFRAMYRWYTYAGGWLVRVVAQAAFLASVGLLVGSESVAHRIAIGAACASAATAALLAIPLATMERVLGTAGLLVVSPAGLVPSMLGRAVERVADAGLTSTTALVAVFAYLPEVRLLRPSSLLLPVLAVAMAYSSTCLAMILAAAALLWPDTRNLLSATVAVPLTLLSGSVLPHDPTGRLAFVSHLVPLGNGVQGCRQLALGHAAGALLPLLGEVLVGSVWLVAAIGSLRVAQSWATRRAGLV